MDVERKVQRVRPADAEGDRHRPNPPLFPPKAELAVLMEITFARACDSR